MILDIDVMGAQEVFKRIPNAVTIFVKPLALMELENRLRARGDGFRRIHTNPDEKCNPRDRAG